MNNMKLAAVLTSLLIVSAPVTAQEKATFGKEGGGVVKNIDWTRLAALADSNTFDGGSISLHDQTDTDLEFALEGAFEASTLEFDAFELKSEYQWGASFATEKPFSDGDNALFRKAGYAKNQFNPAIMADALQNNRGWRFEGGYERSLNERLSLRLSREYTTFGNDFDQWQTKAGLLVQF